MEGEDWILLKSRWRFGLYLILIGNQIQAREEKKVDHVFFTKSIHWGEGRDTASQTLKSRFFFFFIGMSISFWLNFCACIFFFFFTSKVFTHGNDFCVLVPLAAPSLCFPWD